MADVETKSFVARGPTLSLAERISQLVAFVGGPTRAGEVAHVTRQTVSNWTTGKTSIGVEEALALATACGVSLDWIATGYMRRPDLAASGNGEASGTFAVVHRYEPGKTGELVQIEHEGLSSIVFSEGWLERLGMKPGDAALIQATGDAMAPTIQDGSLLLVDRSAKKITGDGIYVLCRAGTFTVRRAQVLVDGAVMLLADNPRYHAERVEAAQVETIAIAGRVRLGIESF